MKLSDDKNDTGLSSCIQVFGPLRPRHLLADGEILLSAKISADGNVTYVSTGGVGPGYRIQVRDMRPELKVGRSSNHMHTRDI